jgi:hypothetical protein
LISFLADVVFVVVVALRRCDVQRRKRKSWNSSRNSSRSTRDWQRFTQITGTCSLNSSRNSTRSTRDCQRFTQITGTRTQMGVPTFLGHISPFLRNPIGITLHLNCQKNSLSNHTFRTVYFGSNMSQIRKKEA